MKAYKVVGDNGNWEDYIEEYYLNKKDAENARKRIYSNPDNKGNWMHYSTYIEVIEIH